MITQCDVGCEGNRQEVKMEINRENLLQVGKTWKTSLLGIIETEIQRLRRR